MFHLLSFAGRWDASFFEKQPVPQLRLGFAFWLSLRSGFCSDVSQLAALRICLPQ